MTKRFAIFVTDDERTALRAAVCKGAPVGQRTPLNIHTLTELIDDAKPITTSALDAITTPNVILSVWSVEDVDTRFKGTADEAEAWLADNAGRLIDRLAELGNGVIDDLLVADGRYTDDEDETPLSEYVASA